MDIAHIVVCVTPTGFGGFSERVLSKWFSFLWLQDKCVFSSKTNHITE